MQVRFPAFEFRSSSPAWGENREAVAIINAGAIIPPAIERYMIRVMRRARQSFVHGQVQTLCGDNGSVPVLARYTPA
jgi:hypothetical protein